MLKKVLLLGLILVSVVPIANSRVVCMVGCVNYCNRYYDDAEELHACLVGCFVNCE